MSTVKIYGKNFSIFVNPSYWTKKKDCGEFRTNFYEKHHKKRGLWSDYRELPWLKIFNLVPAFDYKKNKNYIRFYIVILGSAIPIFLKKESGHCESFWITCKTINNLTEIKAKKIIFHGQFQYGHFFQIVFPPFWPWPLTMWSTQEYKKW